MEVTKHNFKEAVASITSLVKDADFISFDLELTGLGRSLGDRNHDLDTPDERYRKAMRRVKEYGVTQMGISIFRYCKLSKKYLNATFCFFLSGKMEGSYRYDTSSMIFLAENGFDFNKLFLEGLTFISLTDEIEMRKKRKAKLQEFTNIFSPPVKLKDPKVKSFVSEAMKKVKKSLQSGEQVIFEGKSMNGFFKKVLFSNVAPHFPTSHFQNVGGIERNVKVAHFASEDDKRKHLDASWEEDLNEQLGFTHVIKVLLEANKPLVGHNMVLDLLHLVDKFVAPLPPQLDQFKTLVKANVPAVYDTKILARDPPFSTTIVNNSLGCLYEDLTLNFSPPKFEVEKGHQGYNITEDGQAHDGGFDAFMTGICFIIMVKTLDGKRWEKVPMMKSKHLERYSNKISFMGSYDMPYIDMANPDMIPDRSHIFSVSCPSTWTSLNVRHAFAVLKGYKTIWASDTHMYVAPQDEEDLAKVKLLLPEIRTACPPTVRVDFYESREEAAKKNGKLNSGVKIRCKDVVRPSSIKLKRSSDAKDKGGSGEGISDAADCTDSGRNLKRLKSVGSELLSNMTLESPMNVDTELPNYTHQEKKSKPTPISTSEVFSVPEDW